MESFNGKPQSLPPDLNDACGSPLNESDQYTIQSTIPWRLPADDLKHYVFLNLAMTSYKSTQTVFLIMLRFIRLTVTQLIVQLAIALVFGLRCFVVAEEILSVPVLSLTPPAPPETMNLQQNPVTVPPQVTPAARLPQYQLHRRENGNVDDSASGKFRFLLLTPNRPLLIEVAIEVDGRPFAAVREDRIRKVMQFIADPESFRAAEAKAAEEALTNKDRLLSAAAGATGALESLSRLVAEAREEFNAAFDDDESPSSEQKVEVSETPVTAEPVVEATPKYLPPDSIYDRIERHMKATGKKPSAEEVRWLLANWTDGPVLMFLNDNFQRFRAAQQPMFEVLDVNRDRVISADEINTAVAAITSCDLNRDEVVDATEIGKVASDPRNVRSLSAASRPMIARLDQREHVRMALSKLAACYAGGRSSDALLAFDQNSDGVLDDSECQDIQNRTADFVLTVVFHTKNQAVSRLSITGAAGEYRSMISSAEKTENAIVLPFPEFQLEISSVQGAASDQISIGAIDDGYALLPELDQNGDDRFTIRELRTLTQRLKSFDRDNNGAIDFDEILPTHRLCIALGPHAHQPLSTLRQRTATVPETTTAPAPPDWFTEMDKNKDFDLTRTEFPGTDDQFQQLDEDGDGLIDIREAASG